MASEEVLLLCSTKEQKSCRLEQHKGKKWFGNTSVLSKCGQWFLPSISKTNKILEDFEEPVWGMKEGKGKRGIINILTCTNTHFPQRPYQRGLCLKSGRYEISTWPSTPPQKHLPLRCPLPTFPSESSSPNIRKELTSDLFSFPHVHIETWRPCPSFSQMFQCDALASCKPMSPVTQQIMTKLTHFQRSYSIGTG